MNSTPRVIIHLGPHKTGTTSIQQALWDRYGIPTEGTPWYPRLSNPPSQSDLISDFRRGHGATVLRALRDTAISKRCSHLILSSEDFSNLPVRQFSRALDALGDDEVMLVFTLSSFFRRAQSLWHERVKHGSTRSFDESFPWLMDTASLASDLVGRFARACPAARVVVAISDSRDPDMVWRNFDAGTGISSGWQSGDLPLLNTSATPLESELLRTLNVAWADSASVPSTNRWVAVDLMFQMFQRPEWREATPTVSVRIPEEWHRPLRALAAATVGNLIALRNAGRIRIKGHLSLLVDFDRNGEFRPAPLPSAKVSAAPGDKAPSTPDTATALTDSLEQEATDVNDGERTTTLENEQPIEA
jgi:hypothetical protein